MRRPLTNAVKIAVLLGAIATCLAKAALAQFPPPRLEDDPLFEEWRWAHYDVESRLPSNQINAITQSRDGTIWIGTSKGLAWFNGATWEIADIDGDDERLIRRLQPHQAGGVIVLTANNELFAVTAAGGIPITNGPDPSEGYLDITVSGANELLLVTGLGLYSVQLGGRTRKIRGATQPYYLAGDTSGGWVARLDSLYAWTGDDIEPVVPWHSVEVPHAIVREGSFTAITIAQEGAELWTNAGDSGEFRREIIARTPLPLRVAQSGDTLTVVAHSSGELAVRRNGRWQWGPRPSASRVAPRALFLADDGDLWMGTDFGLSVHRAGLRHWTKWPVADLPGGHALVNEIVPAGDSVWVGTSAGLALKRGDGTTTTWTHADTLSLGPITALAVDQDGSLWLGSGSRFNGALRFFNGAWEHHTSTDSILTTPVHRIVKERDRIWFLGLSRPPGPAYSTIWFKEGGSVETWGPGVDLPSRRAYAHVPDGKGGYWTGTLGGLSHWDGSSWTTWTVEHGLKRNNVFTAVVDGDGRVWFAHGRAQGGLGVLNPDGSLHYLDLAAVGVAPEIWELELAPDSAIWAGTRFGVGKVVEGAFHLIDAGQGPTSGYVWPLAFTRGHLLAGTSSDGVHQLDLSDNVNRAPIIVVDPSPTGLGRPPLTWQAFPRRGLPSPADILTRYRFDDGEWSPWTRARSVVPEGLTPGDHTIRVQALGPLGDRGPTQTAYFSVPPPTYRHPLVIGLVSLWALSLFLIAVAALNVKKANLKRLQSRELKYRKLFENAPVGIAREDTESGQLVAANERMGEILGYDSAEDLCASFRPAERIVDEASYASILSALDRAGRAETELQVLRKDDQAIWVRCSVYMDASGRYREVAILDITEERNAQEAQERLAEQLHQAQKMEAVGQLTGGVAHDFNNLLTVIMGSLDMLTRRMRSPDSKTERLARQAILAAQRGSELTRRLLAFSRKQALRPTDLDLNEAVLSLLDLIERTLGGNVEVEFEWNEDLWPCHADPNHLESALLNLCINARDAMPSGGKLFIGAQNETLSSPVPEALHELAPGDYVVLNVRDTGTGITETVRRHAFEPFFTTKEVGKGSGLGLSMVYGFVKQSGGETVIDGQPGRGTLVKLYLPRGARLPTHLRAPHTDAEGPDDHPEKGMTVLLVEDDLSVQELTTTILEDLGYRVIGVDGVDGAMAVLTGDAMVDLLLTDVVLPGTTNGFELARTARQLRPDLPVLCVSGYVKAPSAAGGDAHEFELLTKPFSRTQLAQRIATLVRN